MFNRNTKFEFVKRMLINERFIFEKGDQFRIYLVAEIDGVVLGRKQGKKGEDLRGERNEKAFIIEQLEEMLNDGQIKLV